MSELNVAPMAPGGAEAALAAHYDGRRWALGWLLLRTTLLTGLTLLLYRFWARTRQRRYLWSHVTLAGDRFEYTGTGGELFRGFFRVVLIFAPIAVVIALLDAFVVPGINQIQLPAFVLLTIVGSYYARRYRLTRTRWRGIRGNLVGSAGVYLGLSLLHLLHTMLTLGLTYPIYRLATGRYLIAHSWFGDRQFTCTPRYGRLFLRYAPIWLVTAGLLTGAIVALAPAIAEGMVKGTGAAAAGEIAAAAVGGFVFLVAAVLWWVVMFSVYRLWEFRALMDATRFGDVSMRAQPRWRVLFGAALLTALCVALAATVCAGLGAGASALIVTGLVGPEGAKEWLWPVLTGLGLSLLYPIFVTLKAMLWTTTLMRELVNRLEIVGEPDFAQLVQNRDAVPVRGEGLFDVFDFAG